MSENRHVPDHAMKYCVVVASNSEEVLDRNLCASPMIREGLVGLHVERGARSAALAYNRGLDATDAPYIIFAHQDVYFPANWEKRLTQTIERLDREAPNWALVAPFGVTKEGVHTGPVWTSSLGRTVGKPAEGLVPVESFDELAFVLRRDSGLRFDEGLPGYHMYGTDIVQTALSQGMGAYCANLPVVHNDSFHDYLYEDFATSYHYIRRKWVKRLPVRSPMLWISRHGMHLPLQRLRMRKSMEKRRSMAVSTDADPFQYAANSGWAKL